MDPGVLLIQRGRYLCNRPRFHLCYSFGLVEGPKRAGDVYFDGQLTRPMDTE